MQNGSAKTNATHPPGGDVDLGHLWRAIWRRRFLLLGLTLIVGLVTYFGLGLLRPLYTSEARILIDNEESTFTRPTEGAQTERVALDNEAVSSQVEVLRSRDLAAETTKKLDLSSDPELSDALAAPFWKRWLAAIGLANDPKLGEQERVLNAFDKRLLVYKIIDSRVISVGFTSYNPELAANAANTLADVYLVWSQQHKLGQTKDASDWLKTQIEELRPKVEEQEAKVEKFRSSSGLYSGSNNITLNAQQLSELNSQLILAKAQRSEAEARARLVRNMLKEKGDIDATPEVLKAELIGRLIEQRVQVQRQLSQLQATLLPSHPRVRQLRSELDGVKSQIRDEAQKIVRGLENESEIAGARENSLRTSLNEVKTQTAGSSDDEIRLRALERESKANRDLLENYLARFRDASTRQSTASVPTNATIISRAYVSNIPSFPKKGPIAALVAAATLTLALAVILTQELLRHGPSAAAGPRPVSQAQPGNYPALAPPASGADSRQSATATSGISEQRSVPLLKSIDAVVAHAEAKARGGVPHRLLVVGTGGVEAASDSVALARALARKNRRCVLLDVGGGLGSVSSALRLPRVPGYSELATGDSTFDAVIRVDPDSPLQIITSGASSSSEGADSAALTRVLKALGEAYDCVVVHAELATAKSVSDVLLDGGLMSVAVARENTVVSASSLGPFADPDVRLVVLEKPADRPPSRRLRGLRKAAAV